MMPGIDSSYQSFFETLSDDPDKRTRSWKACQHYRREFHQDQVYCPASTWYGAPNTEPHWIALPGWPCSTTWNGYAPDGVTPMGSYLMPGAAFGGYDDPSWGLPKLYIDDYTGRRVVSPVNLDVLISNSLASMLPGIKPRLSLINSIYELKDIPQLVGTHDRMKRFVDSMGRTLTGVSSLPLKFRTLRDLLLRSLNLGRNNIPSDAFLAYEFGLAPMLQDALNLQRALDGIGEDLKRLRQNASKKLISHYRAALSDSVSDSDTTTNWSPSNLIWFMGGSAGRRRVAYSLKQFNASMEYSYSLGSDISDAEFQILALSDALGVNLNPRIIWAAIPWSFVVDWVIGIGRWLDQFKTRNIEPVTIITKYCWSAHVRRTVECFITTGLQDSCPPMVRSHWVEEDAYIRQPCTPDVYRALQLGGMDTTKFLLGAALAASR
jgi:hypothetical protein